MREKNPRAGSSAETENTECRVVCDGGAFEHLRSCMDDHAKGVPVDIIVPSRQQQQLTENEEVQQK